MRQFLLLFLALFISSPVVAEDASDAYPATELVHSDLPLYGFDRDEVWPRSITGPDIIAGCTSRVAFGDWQFVPHPDNEYDDVSWYRFANYGVFHCAAIFSSATEREKLVGNGYEYGLFVMLGQTKIDGKLTELWSIQQGMRPGSSYMLLSREIGGEGTVKEFTVLQQKCPKRAMREVERFSLDIWLTRYCSINSRDEMLALAKKMARLKPIGTIKLMPNEKGPDETPDPSE